MRSRTILPSAKPRRPRDTLPQAPAALPPPILASHTPSQHSTSDDPSSHSLPQPSSANAGSPGPSHARSVPNVFRLYREYSSSVFPTHDPDEKSNLVSILSEMSTTVPEVSKSGVTLPSGTQSYHPYPNWSSYRLGSWYWSSSALSISSFQELLEILLDPRFDRGELDGINWRSINKKLASGETPAISQTVEEDDTLDCWTEASVTIQVPLHKKTVDPRSAFEYSAGSMWHRNIISALRTKLTDPIGFANFHMEPYKYLWQSRRTVRVHGEAYTSPAFIHAHEKLQHSAPEPGCQLQRVVVALMFASDATLLTDFGHEKLWPLYLAFGNESKYRRSETSCRSFEHIAYFESVSLLCSLFIEKRVTHGFRFPQLPDSFKDTAKVYLGDKAKLTAPLLTHCNRELFHAQWDVLLDEEFLHVYTHGVVIKCYDGVDRRFYPRIFSYSADYPEK